MINQPVSNKPSLYVIPTPIGNLGDITLRALDTLKSVDILLCEDTRVTKKLLNHYDISKQLMTYNDFSDDTIDRIIRQMEEGVVFGLVSDAGCPGIADPGFKLISSVYQHNLFVEVLPGASAFVTALIGANIDREYFQFLGFLKTKASSLEKQLQLINDYPGVSIIYEAPHRLLKTLEVLNNNLDNAKFCVARELTKLHEEWMWGDYQQVVDYYTNNPLKGEIVLLITTSKEIEIDDQQLIKLVNQEVSLGTLKNQAIKKVAKAYGYDKQYVYNLMIEDKDE